MLLWQSYTNLGVDEKNQIDLLRVLPGGVVGLKAVVSEFHSLGVTVLFPWNHWGNTTGAIHKKKRKRRKGHALSHHSSLTLTPTLFLELCKKTKYNRLVADNYFQFHRRTHVHFP